MNTIFIVKLLFSALFCTQFVVSQNAPRNAWLSITSSADGKYQAAAPRYDASGDMARIYLSSDNGNSFFESSSPKHFWETIASSASGEIIVAGQYYGDLFVSLDTGVTWKKSNVNCGAPVTPAGSPASGGIWRSISLSDDGQFVVAASTDFIWVSNDSGVTFKRSNSPDHLWSAIACNSDCSVIVAATEKSYFGTNSDIGRIYVSKDKGDSWVPTTAPLAHWNSVSITANGGKIVATARDERLIYYSNDSGLSWVQLKRAPDNLVWTSAFISGDGRVIIVAAERAIYYSDDGLTWNQVMNIPDDDWRDITCDENGSLCTAASNALYDNTSNNGRLQLFTTGGCKKV